jgi:hypothetical protein
MPGGGYAFPDVQARGAVNAASAVMPDCCRQVQGSRPAVSKRLFAPVLACRRRGLPLPMSSAPGSPSLICH